MKKTLYLIIALGALVSCSKPSYFNNPTHFVGGNSAAAVETHCRYRQGVRKDTVQYKLCQEGFNTHYGQ